VINIKSVHLFTINENVICLKCGNKGAIQSFGNWYEKGIGNQADNVRVLQKYRNKPFMSHTMGFGGTIPWICLNCHNAGLIDFSGLEGYEQVFETIKE